MVETLSKLLGVEFDLNNPRHVLLAVQQLLHEATIHGVLDYASGKGDWLDPDVMNAVGEAVEHQVMHTPIKREQRYVMVDADGDSVEWNYDDTITSDVQGSSMKKLFDNLGDWADTSADDVLNEMQPGEEFDKHEVVVQTIETHKLSHSDALELEKMRVAARERVQKRDEILDDDDFED